jgi:ketosteroid isomerase-like protein
MSQENVEIVRTSFDAWNAGDMDTWSRFLAADVVWSVPAGWPEPGPYVGREAVMTQVRQQRETWNADTAEPVADLIDAGDRVVARFAWRGQGHGPEAILEGTCVYTLDQQLISAFEFFWDHATALKAVGLEE